MSTTKTVDGREYIDLTPTWAGILRTLVVIATEATTAEARANGWKELDRMAKLADAYVASKK